MIIRLPIDIKSMYFHIKNDNKTGHTPTVATPLKQGGSIHREISRILEIPENIDETSKEKLVLHILDGSRAAAKIPHVYVFNNVSVNGHEVDRGTESYCIYIREETDPANVHCGRQKVHYPLSLVYSDENIEINNRKIIERISAVLNEYAFIVQALEYDTEQERLNFDAIIIGESGIPYSKVFLNHRGVGEKFTNAFTDYSDSYDTEIIALRSVLGYEAVTPDNYLETIDNYKRVSINFVVNNLEKCGYKNIKPLGLDYPYGLYDIEFEDDNGIKKFIIVRFTATKLIKFGLSAQKFSFARNFGEDVQLCLVTDVCSNPTLQFYETKDLLGMDKEISSLIFKGRMTV